MKTMVWAKGTDDQRLMARSCGLVFLINKLASSNNEIGIRATVDTLADLLVEDLTMAPAHCAASSQGCSTSVSC